MDSYVIKCCTKNGAEYDLRFQIAVEGLENVCYFLDRCSFLKEGYDLVKVERI